MFNLIPHRRLLSKTFCLAFLALFSLNQGAGGAENWPRWRGPHANGTSSDAQPPVTWNATENVKWKVPVPGFGTSTPIIWDNQVYLLTAIKQGEDSDGGRSRNPTEQHDFVVLALDRETGRTIWRQTAATLVPHEGHHQDHGYASGSPVTDGRHLYAYFGSRGLYCYDLEGKLVWSRDLGDMRTRNNFGEGASPALHGDTIVIKWDHEGDDFIAAFNKNNGELIWREERDEPTSWSTPLIVPGDPAQVIATGTSAVRSYNLANGEVLWETGELTLNAIPTPVTGHGMVYAMSGFRGNQLYAIRLGASGDLEGSDAIVWSYDRSMPYVPSPLLYGTRLYLLKGNNGILSCFDARTGNAYYTEERLPELSGVYASPLGANGHVYITGRNGTTLVLREGPTLQVVATNPLGEPVDASPVAVDRHLFIRSHQHLFCIGN